MSPRILMKRDTRWMHFGRGKGRMEESGLLSGSAGKVTAQSRQQAEWSRVRQPLCTLRLPWNAVLPCWDFQGMEYFAFIPQVEEAVSFYLPLLSAALPQLATLPYLKSQLPTFHTSFSFCNFLNFRIVLFIYYLCHLLFTKTLCLLRGSWSEWSFSFSKVHHLFPPFSEAQMSCMKQAITKTIPYSNAFTMEKRYVHPPSHVAGQAQRIWVSPAHQWPLFPTVTGTASPTNWALDEISI